MYVNLLSIPGQMLQMLRATVTAVHTASSSLPMMLSNIGCCHACISSNSLIGPQCVVQRSTQVCENPSQLISEDVQLYYCTKKLYKSVHVLHAYNTCQHHRHAMHTSQMSSIFTIKK